MSALGVLFALDDETLGRLLNIVDEDDRLEFLQEVIEEEFFENQPEWVVETDKAWDAIHRALTDGDLGWENGTPPLNAVILAGEQLYAGNDYIMSLKAPHQVEEIARALTTVTLDSLKRGYDRIEPDDYDGAKGLEDWQYTWDNFSELPDFYRRAAAAGRSVLFTVDL